MSTLKGFTKINNNNNEKIWTLLCSLCVHKGMEGGERERELLIIVYHYKPIIIMIFNNLLLYKYLTIFGFDIR